MKKYVLEYKLICFILQCYLSKQVEPQNHIYVPLDQYPEIPTGPTVRAQVVLIIPYLSDN